MVSFTVRGKKSSRNTAQLFSRLQRAKEQSKDKFSLVRRQQRTHGLEISIVSYIPDWAQDWTNCAYTKLSLQVWEQHRHWAPVILVGFQDIDIVYTVQWPKAEEEETVKCNKQAGVCTALGFRKRQLSSCRWRQWEPLQWQGGWCWDQAFVL